MRMELVYNYNNWSVSLPTECKHNSLDAEDNLYYCAYTKLSDHTLHE